LYGVPDPALPGVGVFADPRLQALHDDWLALGIVSYAAALQVGVAIEERDILDLQAAIAGTSVKPLVTTYAHLLAGSERHLRSFSRQLEKTTP
jgi:hypothetical protein